MTAAAATPSSVLMRYDTSPRPTQQIVYALPHSGASRRTFHTWAHAMPPDTELVTAVLPGRGPRRDEPLQRRLDSLADELADAVLADIAATAPEHVALYGHSLGALLAHAVAVRIQEKVPQLRAVVASGSRAPLYPVPAPLHELSDNDLVKTLVQLGNLPRRRRSDQGFLDAWLPVVRADLEAAETYFPHDTPALNCTVSVWVGMDDWYALPHTMRSWDQVCALPLRRIVLLPGEHFPAVTAEDLLAELGWSTSFVDQERV